MERHDKLGISAERTGNAYSIASNEFIVSFPNDLVRVVWSPVWNDLEPDEEEEGAKEYALGQLCLDHKRMMAVIRALLNGDEHVNGTDTRYLAKKLLRAGLEFTKEKTYLVDGRRGRYELMTEEDVYACFFMEDTEEYEYFDVATTPVVRD